MAQHYSDVTRASDEHALPDLEVFYISAAVKWDQCPRCTDSEGFPRDGETLAHHKREHVGWYWQACFPGCLPDGEANGPFETEAAALEDAREGVE